nr:MAG TPA: P63C domain protein [Caudoviricetes sp.]
MQNDSIPRATHQGILEIGDARIPCAVLDDGRRVLSENGITNAILGTRSGGSKRSKKAGAPMPLFLTPANLKPFITQDLIDGPLRPVQYKRGAKQIVNGFDASILPAVCNIWLQAREAGILQPQQLGRAQKAELLMRGLAQIGIVALIDEATGYQEERDRNELQRFLALYLSEERLKWAKVFPDEYYKQIFRLKKWEYRPIDTKRPRVIGKITNELVYNKLPPHVLEELQRLNPIVNKRTGRRAARHHQHLSPDVGQPDLHDHLMQLIAIMKISPSWPVFIRNFERAFPEAGATLPLDMDDPEE